MRKVKIGNKTIGDGEDVFVIAEAGVNHNGNIGLAKKLIDVAIDAGADAVKFQTFKADNVVAPDAPTADYQKENTGLNNQYKLIKEMELSSDDFKELAEYSKSQGILFLSSPFDKESVDLLDKIGVPIFKIASGEITNYPLVEYIARKGKPIILSTGMSSLGEIEAALEIIRMKGVNEVVLLHCVTSYPALIEDSNLKVIHTLKHAFKIPVGFSDHTIGIAASLVAVALGACIIEKHFTLDKILPGPDHSMSLDPEELKELVNSVRSVEKALGDGIKRLMPAEAEIQKVARRSIVSTVYIPKGTIIDENMISIKRPAGGIEPKYCDLAIGKKAKRDIKPGELLYWSVLK
jgi:N,N'-diacetyllegionaminate synthase